MLSIATEQQKTLVEYRSEITSDRGGLCWLDLQQPTDQELQTAAQLCGAPVALLEAAADTETTIRSDMEDGWLMLVSRAIRAADKKLDIQHLGVVVKANWLVTLHEAELPETAEVSREWQVEPTTGAAHLLYYLLDALLDGLFPMLDEIEDKLYETEENIIGNRLQSIVLEQILRTSRRLLVIRRVGGALRETANAILRRTPQQEEAWSRFQEIYDHATRAVDIAEMLHEVSSNSIDAHLATVSNQLNSVMKTLTIWATILMTLSLIAGVFGMNFAFPALVKDQSLRGFWFSLGTMGLAALGLLYLFRRMRYLN